MIFIANYWNDPLETIVTVYSNCDNVELHHNNVLITSNEKDQDSSHLLRPPFIFRIKQYISGRLEAEGFINGKSVVRTYRLTPGKIHHHLQLEIDLSGKSLTNNDIVFIYAYICDENNTVIPDAEDLVQFSLQNVVHDQAIFIGDNPVRAEAGIATILLKTSSIVSNNKLTVIASSTTVDSEEARLIVDVTNKS